MTQAKALSDQFTLLQEMQDKGYNLVNCGSCGDVFIHRMELVEITCPYCKFTSEPCDFPDFFY